MNSVCSCWEQPNQDSFWCQLFLQHVKQSSALRNEAQKHHSFSVLDRFVQNPVRSTRIAVSSSPQFGQLGAFHIIIYFFGSVFLQSETSKSYVTLAHLYKSRIETASPTDSRLQHVSSFHPVQICPYQQLSSAAPFSACDNFRSQQSLILLLFRRPFMSDKRKNPFPNTESIPDTNPPGHFALFFFSSRFTFLHAFTLSMHTFSIFFQQPGHPSTGKFNKISRISK